MTRRKTNEEFLSEVKEKNPNLSVLSIYINSTTKVKVHCNICGYEWQANPLGLCKGYGCPNCAGNVKKNNEDYIRELQLINPNIEPLEEYKGNKTPILCKCKNCGNEWKASPNNLLSKGHKCPVCSLKQRGFKQRKTDSEFVKELAEKNPTIIPLDQYVTSQKRIKCKCSICGHVWSATPNNLLDKGSRCPNCSHASTSVIEQILLGAFSVALGKDKILSRDKELIGKELDIVIPHLSLAIEYGAWFWHKNRLSSDNEKQRLCSQKGIHLITILEDCPENIKKELIGDYRLYRENISCEKDYHTIREIIDSICLDYNISNADIHRRWNNIIAEAQNNSRKMDATSFVAALKKINPNVELMEEYTRSVDKLKCKCKKCGFVWDGLPTSLMRGHGCPKCARTLTGIKKTITNEDFLNRLHKINKSIEPLEPYKKGSIAIQCKCKECGNIWEVKPKNLLLGHGCPKCGRLRTSKRQSKPIRCIETGICYESIAEVRRKTGIDNPHKAAKGYQETAGGYHWEYVE